MILSTSKKFILFHIPKTAGSSITNALSDHARKPEFTAINAIRRVLPGRIGLSNFWFEMHDTAAFIQSKMPADIFASYLKFAFVRSPYSHAISHYEFLKSYRVRRIANKVSQMSFQDYLEWRERGTQRAFKSRIARFVFISDQTSFIAGSDGRFLTNTVGKFENLAEDLARICATLDIEPPKLSHRRQGRASTIAGNQQMSGKELDIIHRIYRRDFGNFGYEFMT